VIARGVRFVALALFALALPAFAEVPAPKLERPVTDLTSTLSAEQAARLESRLVALEARKGSQLAILVVPTTQPESIEQFALRVAEKNALGREGPDDGLLLLVAKDDRRARIEVGRGLEGAIPDAIASRVIREYLGPKFRADDYAGGLEDATAALEKLVDGEPLPAPLADEGAGEGGDPFPVALVIGFFVGVFAAATQLKPKVLRMGGAGVVAAALVFFVLGAGVGLVLAPVVAALVSVFAGTRGRYIGHGGGFPVGYGGGGGWGGGTGGGGGGWSGGGGSFGGGGASGGW
jgi:uncharacterized protein